MAVVHRKGKLLKCDAEKVPSIQNLNTILFDGFPHGLTWHVSKYHNVHAHTVEFNCFNSFITCMNKTSPWIYISNGI